MRFRLKNVTDDGLITLGEALAKSCKGLERLEINCFGYIF